MASVGMVSICKSTDTLGGGEVVGIAVLSSMGTSVVVIKLNVVLASEPGLEEEDIPMAGAVNSSDLETAVVEFSDTMAVDDGGPDAVVGCRTGASVGFDTVGGAGVVSGT